MLVGKHIIIISTLLSNIQSWARIPKINFCGFVLTNLLFQPKITIRFVNITHDVLLTQYGSVNTSVSTTGALSIYFHFAREVELFLKLVIDFNSNNVDVNFMNKTVSWCNLLQVPRYEPLIKIVYKVFSQNAHLPQKCPIKKVSVFLKLISLYFIFYLF